MRGIRHFSQKRARRNATNAISRGESSGGLRALAAFNVRYAVTGALDDETRP